MQLFIDSADPKEIQEAMSWGYIDGVTTNPSLAAKVGKPYKEIVSEILQMVEGPVSLETIATDYEGIISEGRALAKLAENVVVKIPCILEGYKAAKTLGEEGINVNMTLCFSASQALLAAKVNATYISPFMGRMDDIYPDAGDKLIEDIVDIYDTYGFETLVLDASIRDVEHVTKSALMGADVATVPFKVLEKLYTHSLTDKGLDKFLSDWKSSGLELPL